MKNSLRKDIIRNLKYFSISEKRHLLILMFLVLTFIIIPHIFLCVPVQFSEPQYLTADTIIQQQSVPQPTYFLFNPNTISKDSLVLLGFSESQAQSILKYRSKGGKFSTANDFKKMYCVTDSIFNILSAYIVLSTQTTVKPTSQQQIAVDINSADTTLLKTLPGIGSYFAKKIVEHRNRIGGFYKVEQLLEIYNFGVPRLKILEPYITIDTTVRTNNFGIQIQPLIDINSADTTLLKTLSGIGSYFAKKIVEHRNRLGGFYKAEQLLEIYNFGTPRLEKIRHSISFDTTYITPLNFRTQSAEELGKHPYLTYKTARAAIKLQQSLPHNLEFDDLVRHKILSSEEAEKLKPYL